MLKRLYAALWLALPLLDCVVPHPVQARLHGITASTGGPIYDQAMGTTDANGFVVAFPLSPTANSLPAAPVKVSGHLDNGTIGTPGNILTITFSTGSAALTPGETLYASSGPTSIGVLQPFGTGGTTGTGGNGTYIVSNSSLTFPTNSTFLAAPGARQFWINTAIGADSYNCLSPYPGFQMNGTGASFQYGATGQGSANAAYGPCTHLLTTVSQTNFQLLNNDGTFNTPVLGSANQFFLAQGQTFTEGGAIFNATFNGTNVMTVNSVSYGNVEAGLYLAQLSNQGIKSQVFPLTGGETVGGPGRYNLTATQATGTQNVVGFPTSNNLGSWLNFRNGESVAYPMTFQSYDPADPLNTAKQGRATGSNRPTVRSDPIPTTATGTISIVGGVGTLTLDSGSLLGDAVKIGQYITGTGIASNTFITGGSGLVWQLNIPQTVADEAISLGGIGQSYQLFSYGRQDNPTAIVAQGNWVWRGLHFASLNVPYARLSISGNPYNVLLENDVFDHMAAGVSSPSALTGYVNANNIIYRHSSAGRSWWNQAPPSEQGFGAGHTNNQTVEDCVVWESGYQPDTDGRQAAFVSGATLSAGTLTITGTVTGTIAIGQQFAFDSGGGSASGYITGGSGTSWTVSNTSSTVATSQPLITTNWNTPNVYNHGIYYSYGANTANGGNGQAILRRFVSIDSSASGASGRGSLLAYNNVLIDNPVQMVAGGSVSSTTSYTVSQFTAAINGTSMVVSAMSSPPPYFSGSAIYPGQSTFLAGTGVTGSPYVASQTFPLNAGESAGGPGRYTLSVSQSSLSGTFTTTAKGYAGESPGGVMINYHDNLVLGSNNINALVGNGTRNNGISIQNGQSGSNMLRNLFANSVNAYGNSSTFMFGQNQGGPQFDVAAYIDLNSNVSYNFTNALEDTAGLSFPSQLHTTYGNGGASPGNNVINNWTISSGSYNNTTGVVSLTLTTSVNFTGGSGFNAIGALTGTGVSAINQMTGANLTASGTSVTMQLPSGLGTGITITGGSMGYSPASNAQVYAAMQAQGWGDGTRDGLAAVMVANPDQPWAYRLLNAASPLFNNFPFVLQ